MKTLIDAHHRSGQVPMLWSPPGEGKSALIRELSERDFVEVGGKQLPVNGYVDLRLGAMEPQDLAGIQVKDSITIGNDSFPIARFAMPDWAVEALKATLDNKGVFYVIFDELNYADYATQGAALGILLERRLPSGIELPDTVFFVAAGNPSDEVSGVFELSDATSSRLAHYNFNPSLEEWLQGLLSNFDKPIEAISEKEQHYRTVIASYLRSRPANVCETQDQSSRKRGWANKRSWTRLATVLASIDSPEEDLIHIQALAAVSLIGERIAGEFTAWLKGSRLPTHTELIASPEILDQLDVTQIYAVLENLISISQSPKYNVDLLDVLSVINYAGRNNIEVATGALHKILDDLVREYGVGVLTGGRSAPPVVVDKAVFAESEKDLLRVAETLR